MLSHIHGMECRLIFIEWNVISYSWIRVMVLNTTLNNISVLSNICMFSFEFKESSMSDTRCLIQDVVSPQW